MMLLFNISKKTCYGKQAALHVLANIAGETRPEDKMNLSASAEENLRRLIYEVASRSSKLTPSVSLVVFVFYLFLSLIW